MHIIVLIKQILDASGVTVRRDKERIFVNEEAYVISPGDKNGLEAAFLIKDAASDTKVTAVCLGAARADDALREAMAMGADSAYLLCDPAFEKTDLAVRARILAAAVRKIGADLVITGREAGDAAAGQIGPRVAELLKMAQITDVYQLKVEDSAVTATRRWGSGFAQVKTALPALISIAPGSNVPRYAHGARIMNAYRMWQVKVWGAADLDLQDTDLTSLTVFHGQSFPPPLERNELISGNPVDAAQQLADILRAQRLIKA